MIVFMSAAYARDNFFSTEHIIKLNPSGTDEEKKISKFFIFNRAESPPPPKII